VSERTEKVQVVRRKRVLAPAAEPSWQDVLYRGAAATDTGAYFEGGGSFKILAMPPAAPPQHNRRTTDRNPVDRDMHLERRDRRSGDRAGTAADRVGSAADRSGGGPDRAEQL